MPTTWKESLELPFLDCLFHIYFTILQFYIDALQERPQNSLPKLHFLNFEAI